MTYRILDWDEHFENHDSRRIKNISWQRFPIKHDGCGLRLLLASSRPNVPDEWYGLAMFGAFVLSVQVAAKMPKRGELVDMTPQKMSVKTGAPASAFVEMFRLLCDKGTGICWMEGDGGVADQPAPVPAPMAEEEHAVAPPTPAEPAGVADLRGLDLYESDVRLHKQWPELMAAWRVAHPNVDVLGEVRKAHAWEVANPTRRKKDRAKFLSSWIARATPRPQSTPVSTGGLRKWN